MISVQNLSLFVQNKVILENINFSMDSGLLGVFGPNGIGKSTLLRTIAGHHKNFTGDVLINSINIRSFHKQLLARNISFIPQEYTTYLDFSVKDLTLLGRTPYLSLLGKYSQNDFKIVETILHDIGLNQLQDRPISSLSSGERRLTILSMALAQMTPIIILDEPTNFLDIYNTVKTLRLLKELSITKKKLIIVSIHDINFATSFFDSVLFLCPDKYSIFGESKIITNEVNLKKMFGLDFQVIHEGESSFFVPKINSNT
ncbi:MAG: ABC transporter ATP-binding protein [Ignavibacteria bacterium]|nr:ABC transporter ATP-binding protein [Ignavibacteria bacterium]